MTRKEKTQQATMELALRLLDILNEESGHDARMSAQAAGIAAMHLLVVGAFSEEHRTRFFNSLHTYLADLDQLAVRMVEADEMGEPPTKAIH
jgi:hypothetical protein